MSATDTTYQFSARVPLTYDDAVARVTAELKKEGFGVLTEIDVKATLKQKLDVEFRRYTILGACNPVLAHQALQEELEIGLLLPCNVIVYEVNGGSVISIVDPLVMLGVVDNPALKQVAAEAQACLRRVAEAVQK